MKPAGANPAGESLKIRIKGKEPASGEASEFSRFAELTKKLASVPKEEVGAGRGKTKRSSR